MADSRRRRRSCRHCGWPIRCVRLANDRGVKWWHVDPDLAPDHAAEPDQHDGLAEPSTVKGEAKLPQTPTSQIDGADG